jgi:hypothetical protein
VANETVLSDGRGSRLAETETRGEKRKTRSRQIVEKSRRSVSGAVTREVLDVARYITDVTAQLEALAIAAHLDQLAYSLGTGKRKAKYWFASAASRSRARGG